VRSYIHVEASSSTNQNLRNFTGIILLQPPPSNAVVKKTGRQLHTAFQGLATLLIITGATFIIYNKASHGGEFRFFGLLRVNSAVLSIDLTITASY